MATQQVMPQTDQAPAQDQENLGPNFEKLDEVHPEIVAALKSLQETYRKESAVSRRYQIRRARQARYFWQGLQYLWWDHRDMNWHLPTDVTGAISTVDVSEMPRYQYTTNFYKAYGLNFIALISQSLPNVRFYPQSAQDERDITTAKAASVVSKLIEKNNRAQEQLGEAAYYAWNDGIVGAYVRYVADADRFGVEDQNILEESLEKVGQDVYICPSCQAETPQEEAQESQTCPQCGAPLGSDNLRPAQMASVPEVSETKQFAKGREVITYMGGLELHTPPWANTMNEFPYLNWSVEIHKTKLMDAYPHAADKLESAGGGGTADDIYARIARTTIRQNLPYLAPGDLPMDLITFSRTWIRPWAFNDIQDKTIRAKLKELFPVGCYVAFAGDTYCEARNESMDWKWRVCNPEPGDGQGRPGVGDTIIDIQEQYNTLSNIEAETYEYGIPPMYADPEVFSADAWQNQTSEPGAMYPARPRSGMTLAESFYQPAPAMVAPESIKRRQELMGPTAQFLTGIFPAIFGGEADKQTTAAQYSMMREQAMGRLGLVWRRMRRFYAEVMLLAVETFRENRTEDVEYSVFDDSGEFGTKQIRLADLKGNISIEEEADESYPALKSQQRGVLQQMLANPDPAVQAVLAHPANLAYMKEAFGLPELVVPGEDSRLKQLREIEQILKKITVMVDPLLDDHAMELGEIKRWANSDAGQAAKNENPQGFEAVRQHATEHQMAMAPPPMPVPPAEETGAAARET